MRFIAQFVVQVMYFVMAKMISEELIIIVKNVGTILPQKISLAQSLHITEVY